jgi:hypothetical protein
MGTCEQDPQLLQRVSETLGQNPNSAEMLRVQDQVGRGQRLFQFLQKLMRSGEVPTATADVAWRTWNQLKTQAAGPLLVPDASGGPNGGLLFFWDQGEHHLELEFLADGEVEFFYRNRRTGTLWGADHHNGQPFAEEILSHVAFFHLPFHLP